MTQTLLAAERPLIYYGIGARKAGKELEQLSKTLKIPLMSTYPAKGIESIIFKYGMKKLVQWPPLLMLS
ncbi:hypothetical protein WP50_33685 [Lactiplantibacillus plantarum]|nr:hypothetical protein WP50_33685 [Lactiplantibacillus plantarum]